MTDDVHKSLDTLLEVFERVKETVRRFGTKEEQLPVIHAIEADGKLNLIVFPDMRPHEILPLILSTMDPESYVLSMEAHMLHRSADDPLPAGRYQYEPDAIRIVIVSGCSRNGVKIVEYANITNISEGVREIGPWQTMSGDDATPMGRLLITGWGKK